MSSLEISGLSKRYGSQAILDRLDLKVNSGEFISLLGPSGCGKTTLLRLIAGLTPSDGGQITVDGLDLTALPAHRRNIGVVFQNYALFPHLTVGENIAFGLKAGGLPRSEISGRVREALQSVKLEALRDRPISALSGGQQQRVAVARALATRPRLVLLDEPLSALDRKLREHMQIELRRMLRDAGMTAIFVTHDQEEALVMSDRIAVMNRGVIEQFDLPQNIYAKPASLFALNFVGLSSQFRGQVVSASNGHVLVDTPAGQIRAPGSLLPGSTVTLAVRPEAMRLGSSIAKDRNQLSLSVTETVYLGARRLVYFQSTAADSDDSEATQIMAELPAQSMAAPQAGEQLVLSWAVDDTLLFPAAPQA
jgi:putative spermidine/putrescine transport system ATP-binding protein